MSAPTMFDGAEFTDGGDLFVPGDYVSQVWSVSREQGTQDLALLLVRDRQGQWFLRMRFEYPFADHERAVFVADLTSEPDGIHRVEDLLLEAERHFGLPDRVEHCIVQSDRAPFILARLASAGMLRVDFTGGLTQLDATDDEVCQAFRPLTEDHGDHNHCPNPQCPEKL